MSYILNKDLLRTIQDVNLQQIISADSTILEGAIIAAEAEAKSYLRQKYQLDREFQDITEYVLGASYNVFKMVYLNAPAYNPAASYPSNATCLYNGIVYRLNPDTTPEAPIGPFNIGDWVVLGNQYDTFYVNAPYPEFTYGGTYALNNHVFWKNKTYICKVPTTTITHEVALQYGFYQNLPYTNVAPDDPVNGLQYWGSGSVYSTNKYVTDTTDWTKGDNRDAQMVMFIIDVALFHLHSRIAPRNIPELRVKRYEAAVDWFHMCAEGKVTPALPLIQPKQGNRIRFGGNVKNINNY